MDYDPENLQASYELAMFSGDYSAAEHALADPRLKGISIAASGGGAVISEPVALHRALVAWLRGQREAAKQFAGEGIALLRARHPTLRQQPYDLMSLARAEACAGRSDEAVRDARAAAAAALQQDPYTGVDVKNDLGRIYVMLDHREEALAVLREILAMPLVLSPNELRFDPIWSRLKNDPRFEEILKSAKPL